MSRRYIPIRVRRKRTQSWFRKFKNYTALGGSPGVAQLLPDRDSDFWAGYTVPVPDYLSTLSLASGNLSLLGGAGIDFTAGGDWLYQRKCVGLMDENRAWSPVAGIETTKTATSFVGGANDLEPSQSWVCVAILRSLNDLGVDRIFKKHADDASGQTGNCFYRDGTTIKHRAYFEGDFVESEVASAVSRDYSLVAGMLDARDERVGVAAGATTDWNATSFGDSDLSNTGNATLFENWNALAGTHYVWIGFWLGTDAEDMIDNWSDFVDNFWKHGQINDLTVDADNTVLIPAQGTDGGLAAVTTDRPRLGADGLIIHSARTMNPLRSLLDSGKWSRRAVSVDRQAADGPDGLRSVITLTEEEDNNTFSLVDENELPGVECLDPYMKINGVTYKPILRINGIDANSASWDTAGFGGPLKRISVATEPAYLNGVPGYGLSNSVRFNASDYYQALENDTGNITTADIIIELIFKTSGADREWLFAKRVGSGGYEGYAARWEGSTNTLYFEIDTSPVAAYLVSGALPRNSWQHALGYINRDEVSTNGSQWWLQGVLSGSGVDFSSAAASIGTSVPFTVGYKGYSGLEKFSSNIAYLAIWSATDMIQAGADGKTELGTIAAERSAKFWGQHPAVAHGNSVPSVITRSCAAFTEKVESGYIKLYQVGSEALRTVHRKDENGDDVYGYLPETQATNLVINSEIFAGWTKLDAGDTVADNQAVCPDGRTVAASVAADTDVSAHGIRYQPTLTVASYVYSIFAKPGIWDWILIWDVTSGVKSWFNISAGAKGTFVGSGAAYMEGPFYNDFYRSGIQFTGTLAAHDLRVYYVNANNTETVAGTGAVNTYFWGAQCELGDYMTSPIITAGATGTRLKDNLILPAGANIGGEDNARGTLIADTLLPNHDNSSLRYVAHISDGAAAADSIALHVAADDALAGDTRATAGNDGNATVAGDCSDGVLHTVRIAWEANNVVVSRDGVDGTADTTAGMPDDQDVFGVGQNNSAALQLKGLIQNLRIYSNIIGDNPTVEHSIRETITVENSTMYTVFVVAKAFGSGAGRGTGWGRLLRLEVDLATDRWAEFDLDDGTIPYDSGAEIGYCVDIGDDWYLTALTFETEGADAGDVDLIIRLEDDNESTTYAGEDGVGVYLSEVAMMEGDFALLSANNPTEETALAKIDCDLADSTLIEKLSKDASELIIDFTLSAPLYTGGAIFTVYENATNYITFSIGLVVA